VTLSIKFPIRNVLKQVDALSPLLCNFALEYTIRMVQVNQDGLELNDTHQLLVYADDDSIWGGRIHTIKKNAEALVVTISETGLAVNADKTKYMVMFRYQNAGRKHSTQIERVEKFKYLGTNLKNRYSVQEEFKSRLNSGNACYHSVQKSFSSSLLSKNLKIKIYRTIIFPVLLYMCKI